MSCSSRHEVAAHLPIVRPQVFRDSVVSGNDYQSKDGLSALIDKKVRQKTLLQSVVAFATADFGKVSMRGTMMDFPLTLPTILERAGKIFGRVEIVLRRPDRSITRRCYGEFYRRARRLGSALTKLGDAARGSRGVDDVEPRGTSGGVLWGALRRRHLAYVEFAPAPT